LNNSPSGSSGDPVMGASRNLHPLRTDRVRKIAQQAPGAALHVLVQPGRARGRDESCDPPWRVSTTVGVVSSDPSALRQATPIRPQGAL